jgi:hypothetical protein
MQDSRENPKKKKKTSINWSDAGETNPQGKKKKSISGEKKSLDSFHLRSKTTFKSVRKATKQQ